MKKFIIRVNGKAYDVEVDEVKGDMALGQPETRLSPDVRPKPVPERLRPAVQEPAVSSGSINEVTAPMAGTVVKIFVKAGDTVDSGDSLLILEAMKMENDVVAARQGKIVSVNVEEGRIINAGDVLITME